MPPFEQAKQRKAAMEREVARLSRVLERFPKNPMGLVPNEVRFNADYRAVKCAFDTAFSRLQCFTKHFVQSYPKECAADRRSRSRL